jgi:hypothetical protein
MVKPLATAILLFNQSVATLYLQARIYNMPEESKQKIIVVILLLCSLLMLSGCVTPAPQEMTILVINAPEDLEMQIDYCEDLGSSFQARTSRRLWETTFRFYLTEVPATVWHYEEITVLASSEEYGEFRVTTPVPRWGDFSIRLDLETQSISQGYTHGRNLMIICMWLFPLFALDSFVFFLFGHRAKQSWKTFTQVNLAMQILFVGGWSLFHVLFSSNVVLALLAILSMPLLIPGARIAKWIVEIILYRKRITEFSVITGSASRITVCAVVMNSLGLLTVIILGVLLPLPRL